LSTLCTDFIFDAVLSVVYAAKIVVSFYKVAYARIKRGVVLWWAVHIVFVPNSLR